MSHKDRRNQQRFCISLNLLTILLDFKPAGVSHVLTWLSQMTCNVNTLGYGSQNVLHDTRYSCLNEQAAGNMYFFEQMNYKDPSTVLYADIAQVW